MLKATRSEEGDSADALLAMANSSNVIFQRSAALAFLQISDKDNAKIDCKGLKPLLNLLVSKSDDVRILALKSLYNFATDDNNARLVVLSGAMVPLISLLMQPVKFNKRCLNIEAYVQILIALSLDQNKKIIASSGFLVPLLSLTQSEDAKLQMGATMVVKELAQLTENRQLLVDAGTIPIVVKLLKSSNFEVRISSVVILNRIAFDTLRPEILAKIDIGIVTSIIALTALSTSTAKQEAGKAFFCLAHEERFQNEIVKRGGLESLQSLLLSTDQDVILVSILSINLISDNPLHQSRVIDGDFLERLSELLGNVNEQIQERAASTLFRLSHYGELGKAALVNAGVVERARALVQSAPPEVQGLMTILASTLTDSDKLRPRLVPLGILDIFIVCTASQSANARGRAMDAINKLLMNLPDCQPFIDTWEAPAGGIHGSLLRFLESTDESYRKRALGGVVLMLKGKSVSLRNLVKNSTKIKAAVKRIAQVSGNASNGQPKWEMNHLFNDIGAYNVNAAKSILNIMGENGR
ncbi:Vacuolar protein 8 [Mortierella sp. AM989]|nr:Vacuolar protein 8 [Mortierella sp. AM989]